MSYNGAGTLRPGINAFRHFTPFHFILLNNQGANRKSTNCFLCLLVNEKCLLFMYFKLECKTFSSVSFLVWYLFAIASTSRAKGYGFEPQGRHPKLSHGGYRFFSKTCRWNRLLPALKGKINNFFDNLST